MSFYMPHLCGNAKEEDLLEKSHKQAVLNIAKLIKELKLSNIHEQFYAYCYLLWNGYFSIDKEYFYNCIDIKDEDNTIFLGKGCCRHNSKLLEEIFLVLEYLYCDDPNEKFRDLNAFEIGVRLLKTNFDSMINIDTKEEKNDCVEKGINFGINHSVTAIENNGSIYLLDPTNLVECEVLKNGKLYCPNGEYIVNKKMLKKEINYFYIYHFFKNKPTIFKELLEKYYKQSSYICTNNIKLFDDFFVENHSNYEKIKQLIK